MNSCILLWSFSFLPPLPLAFRDKIALALGSAAARDGSICGASANRFKEASVDEEKYLGDPMDVAGIDLAGIRPEPCNVIRNRCRCSCVNNDFEGGSDENECMVQSSSGAIVTCFVFVLVVKDVRSLMCRFVLSFEVGELKICDRDDVVIVGDKDDMKDRCRKDGAKGDTEEEARIVRIPRTVLPHN